MGLQAGEIGRAPRPQGHAMHSPVASPGRQKEARQWQEQAPTRGGDDDGRSHTGIDTGGHLPYIAGAAQTALSVRLEYTANGRKAEHSNPSE